MDHSRPLILLAWLALVTPLAADTAQPQSDSSGRVYPPRVYTTVRLAGDPPAIDGRLDDPAWREGEWSGGYRQQIPKEGAEPSEQTSIQLLYDDRNLYVAIRAYDDPAKMHRFAGRRDDFTGDVVGFCLDSYNDRRTGFEFDLTAAGAKIDLILGNAENDVDKSWDAVWDGATGLEADAWTAEFRIPLSQLRYGSQHDQVWGLHAWRWIDRNQEEDQWQLIPRQNTGRMHQLGELRGISGLSARRRLELLPHLLGRADREGGGGDASGAAGIDAKIGLSSSFTLEATVNPDFGQVEADPSVMNLTAYETFYEEKRPFFLEGKSILSFGTGDQAGGALFYSRRVGHAPAGALRLGAGETADVPESTTIVSALKVTGKTPGGLSVGVVQSLTQREEAQISSQRGAARSEMVEPWSSYTVARVHKDWGKGNTSLGAMVTSVRRFGDPERLSLADDAWTGGLEFAHYFGDRSWVAEGRGVWSRVSGASDAILGLQRNAVHYFQRPDASHLEIDEGARSLAGQGGLVRLARTDKGRWRFSEEFSWGSPGLDLNDLGYLQQADFLRNELSVGWQRSEPSGIFRSQSVSLEREEGWDFGGTKTNAQTSLDLSASFRNKWSANGGIRWIEPALDTRLLRGGPAMRLDSFLCSNLNVESDGSKRYGGGLSAHGHFHSRNRSRQSDFSASSWLQPSRALRFSVDLDYSRNRNDLQYVATRDLPGSGVAESRFVLGRVEQRTWALTLRGTATIRPALTLQYYASPFVSTGRFSRFRSATLARAAAYDDRFHMYGADEIVRGASGYEVREGGRGTFSFDDPDFSFRELRSNLVLRWEWKPGSALYAVWSQGRTSEADLWEPSVGSHWRAIWRTAPQDVFLIKLSYWFAP